MGVVQPNQLAVQDHVQLHGLHPCGSLLVAQQRVLFRGVSCFDFILD